MLGMGLGAERVHDYADQFGFGEGTGWVLGGEVSGRLHPVRAWDGLTISRLPAGYAVNVTPMQMHYAMATIASGGRRHAPFIIKRILDANGDTVMEYRPPEPVRVVSEATADEVSSMLAGVVGPGGTARRAAINGFQVAGKTGTTQKIINGRYSNRHHVASFSGFFPAADPHVVVTVVVNEPRMSGTGYGGVVAAPAFQRIGERLVRYLNIEPISTSTVASHP